MFLLSNRWYKSDEVVIVYPLEAMMLQETIA